MATTTKTKSSTKTNTKAKAKPQATGKTTGKATGKGKSRKPSGKTPKAAKVSLKARIASFFGEKLKFGLSIAILIAAVFIMLSMISYVFNGQMDQAAVEAGGHLTGDNCHNWCGVLGAKVAKYFLQDCFGLASLFIPLFLIQTSMRLMNAYRVRLWKWFINFSLIMIWASVLLAFAQCHFISKDVLDGFAFVLGGTHGEELDAILEDKIGMVPTFITLVACLVLYCVYLTSETIDMVRKAFRPQDLLHRHGRHGDESEDLEDTEELSDDDEADETEELDEEETEEELEPAESISTVIDFTHEGPMLDLTGETLLDEEIPHEETVVEPLVDDEDLIVEVAKDPEEAEGNTAGTVEDLEPYDPRKDLANYKFPGFDLLDSHGASNSVTVDMEEQKKNKDRIKEVLQSFGVEIQSNVRATVGPTITLYEITPAPGVRISKIRNLEDDIALSLSANGIRIIAPIPGKGTIGIEVPNAKSQIVSMESLLNSRAFQETKYELPIALGKTITNEVYMVDLAKLPHLLVAGATGQGKSVGLNAIIGSLLYKKHPAELKFVMVDPKKVEFSIYSPLLKHFLAAIPDNDEPIITDVHKVVRTLKSLCVEMDARYDLLKAAKCKNVKEYNAKFKARQLNPNNGHRFMPYIVVIIDEFGDLIMTAGKEVELPIARIAQLARAVGIHMVIATQRPTTTIITGNIKANFPGRMAFKVMQRIDSQTILDRTGANQLVGRGDMLFLAGAEPVRVQCAFLDTPEVENISEFIGQQQGFFAPYELPEPPSDDSGEGGGGMPSDMKLDPMFAEIAQWVVAAQQGSTSAIQRKFEIGYNRAGRITDQLEKAGIVGPARGAKPRDVLIQDDQSLQTILEMMQARG